MKREEALKIAKPILFNTEMVWAIQNRKKTATRRIAKSQPPKDVKGTYERMDNGNFLFKIAPYENIYDFEIKPKYQAGDILYVRETWQYIDFAGDENGYVYRASENGRAWEENSEEWKWKPAIHFPKCAARIFLRVTRVWVERLQDAFFRTGSTIFALLSEGVAIGEQCRKCIGTYGYPSCIDDESECGTLDEVRGDYFDVWNGTVKKSDLDKYGVAANPWVVVYEFEALEVE